MATPFDTIYDSFLTKITDYSFVNFTELELEDELKKYLRSACVKFSSAGNRLTRDFTLNEFAFDLSDIEVEILSLLMLIEYLNPKIVATENMKQFLASKEYKIYSQANHLEKMLDLKKQYRQEAHQLMAQYSYQDGIGGLQ